MEISQVYEIILAAAPAISAVLGIIISLVAGVKKIKNNNAEVVKLINKANDEALAEIRQTNKELLEAQQELAKQNLALQVENQELRDLTRRTLEKLNHIRGK